MNYEEIEKLLLSMLMNETSLILECRLSAECFEKAEHRKIFDEMKKQKEIDIFKLTQKFKEFTDYIFEIIGYVVSTSKYAEYEDELIERYERKRIMGVAKNVGLMCKDGEDITKILEEAHKIQNVEEKEADIKYILADIVEELTGGKEIAKYPTGYPKLDEMLGGFTIGQLNLIAARPSVGKTLFALNLALKQVQMGFKVAFFSMEMDNKEIVQRILARNSGLRLRAFRNKIEDNEKMEKVGKAMEELEVQLKTLYLFDNIYYKSKIERKIRRLKAKVNIDLVYIDYLGLIKGKANENKYQVVSEISRDLKQLARELKITIVCLAQLNREMEKRGLKVPMLSDLRDSGSLEQDADIVIMPHRELDEDLNKIQVYIRKNRNGRVGETELGLKLDSMQLLNDIPKPF